MQFHTPPKNQGQTVEVSYMLTPGGVVRRSFDRSDRSELYSFARYSRTLERWSNSVGPWNAPPPRTRWTRISKRKLETYLSDFE